MIDYLCTQVQNQFTDFKVPDGSLDAHKFKTDLWPR